MISKVYEMYFSATDTTKKVVSTLAKQISSELGFQKIQTVDFTPLDVRQQSISFDDEDIVIIGVPVIAGRVPNVLLKYLHTIKGNGALAVAVVVYGNRNYDDALVELYDILKSRDFKVIAGGAFIGEHSFSNILAKDRPDENDIKIVTDFGSKISEKVKKNSIQKAVNVKGQRPYRDYYKPKDKDGNSVDIRKVTPKTSDTCVDCKICAEVCPMNSIDYNDVSKLNGICIKCCACIKKCSTGSKYFDDENFLNHKIELEINLVDRREPELFL